jgi:Rhs element Vgr protein
MAASPWQAIKTIALRCTVKINGTVLDDDYGISSITITHKINTISTAELSIAGSYSPDFSRLPAIDDATFAPGNKIVITAGYDNNGETIIFDGYIMSHSMSISGKGPINLTVSCKHKAVTMTYWKRDQEFTDKKDSDIITSLFSDNGISATVDATDTLNKQFYQAQSSDWDVVRSRAEVNGFLIFLDGDNVTVGKPKFGATPVLTVAAGNSLLDFNAELSAEKQYSSIIACSWDNENKSLLSVTSEEPTVNAQGSTNLANLFSDLNQKTEIYVFDAPLSQSELKKFADSRLMRVRLSALRGSISLVGSSLVKTGSIIELQGVGKMYNGNAFVSSVKHSISAGLWKTSVQFGLENKQVSDFSDFSGSSAKSQLPLIEGLKTATVTKLSADPEGRFRVKVRLNNASNSSNIELWAQYVSFYATNESGLGFLPEVGDTVVIGFLGNDPRLPVILGALYDKKITPSNPPQDENNYIKLLTTKSKLSLSFDDEKKIIVVKTPAGNTITMSDDGKSIEILDQTKNSIKMSEDGIVLTSKKDLKISATGNINIEATGKLTLDSKQDMAATSSMNISHEAKIGFTAKGNATAEVSASGQTTVKGGMVMIN